MILSKNLTKFELYLYVLYTRGLKEGREKFRLSGFEYFENFYYSMFEWKIILQYEYWNNVFTFSIRETSDIQCIN